MTCDTKERIAQIALELFSQHGFAAVSIRDICRDAQIKESTIYYHYKSKQAILDELLNRVERIVGEKQARFNVALEHTEQLSEEAVVFVAQFLLQDYFLNPSVFPLIRMLSIERIHDETAEQKYQHIVYLMPLNYQTEVFSLMIKKKLIRPCNPETISISFYSIIYMAFSQYCLGKNLSEQNNQHALVQIKNGISNLYQMIKP